MSKNSVWNRGKHNGAGLSKKPPVNVEEGSESTEETAPVDNSKDEAAMARIDTVKPMNRSNWVSRPARTKPQKPERKE